MAQRRINAMGISDIAKVVEHDVTATSVMASLPALGTVDAISMSYSFSMIPDQQAALTNATKLLKKGGFIGIADFFLEGNYDDALSPLFSRLRKLESLFHKTWFAQDHVHLLGDKQLEMGLNELDVIWDNRFRGAVPFLPFLVPYHGVYMLRKK